MEAPDKVTSPRDEVIAILRSCFENLHGIIPRLNLSVEQDCELASVILRVRAHLEASTEMLTSGNSSTPPARTTSVADERHLPWELAVLESIDRITTASGSSTFTFQDFTKNGELEIIKRVTQTKGKTPEATLRQKLQKLDDDGLILFPEGQPDGTYVKTFTFVDGKPVSTRNKETTTTKSRRAKGEKKTDRTKRAEKEKTVRPKRGGKKKSA